MPRDLDILGAENPLIFSEVHNKEREFLERKVSVQGGQVYSFSHYVGIVFNSNAGNAEL